MSRAIIWSIVGIVVVLGVVFIVLPGQKQKKLNNANIPLSDNAYEAFATRFEHRIDKVRENAAKAKGSIGSPSPAMQAMIDDLDAKLEEFATAISELRGKTTATEREEAVRHVRELNLVIRKSIRSLGGTTGSDDGE